MVDYDPDEEVDVSGIHIVDVNKNLIFQIRLYFSSI